VDVHNAEGEGFKANVDACGLWTGGGGSQILLKLCGRHKWMSPLAELEFEASWWILFQVEEAAQSVSQTDSSSSQSSKDGAGASGRGPAAIASGMMMKFLGNGSA